MAIHSDDYVGMVELDQILEWLNYGLEYRVRIVQEVDGN